MAVILQVSWADSGPTRGQLGPTWGRPGPRDRSQRRGNGRGMPGGRFSGPGDHSGPISSHFNRFRARPPICDLNIVILPQLRLLRHQHCVLRQERCLLLQQKTSVLSHQRTVTSVLSQPQTSVLSQQQTSVLSQQQTSVLSQPVLARTGKLINVR